MAASVMLALSAMFSTRTPAHWLDRTGSRQSGPGLGWWSMDGFLLPARTSAMVRQPTGSLQDPISVTQKRLAAPQFLPLVQLYFGGNRLMHSRVDQRPICEGLKLDLHEGDPPLRFAVAPIVSRNLIAKSGACGRCSPHMIGRRSAVAPRFGDRPTRLVANGTAGRRHVPAALARNGSAARSACCIRCGARR